MIPPPSVRVPEAGGSSFPRRPRLSDETRFLCSVGMIARASGVRRQMLNEELTRLGLRPFEGVIGMRQLRALLQACYIRMAHGRSHAARARKIQMGVSLGG